MPTRTISPALINRLITFAVCASFVSPQLALPAISASNAESTQVSTQLGALEKIAFKRVSTDKSVAERLERLEAVLNPGKIGNESIPARIERLNKVLGIGVAKPSFEQRTRAFEQKLNAKPAQIPPRLADNVLVLVDSSSSMQTLLGNESSRVSAVRDSLSTLLPKLSADRNIEFIFYSMNANNVPIIRESSRQSFVQDIESLKLGSSGLPLALAMSKAASKLTRMNGTKQMILLVSGTDTCEMDPAEVANKFAKRFDIETDVIALGVSEPATSTQLEKIAYYGRGRYAAVDNLDALKTRLTERISPNLSITGQSHTGQ